MDLDVRFGASLPQKTNASRLVPGKILIDHASTGQDQREFVIRNLVRRVVFNRMKLRLTVRMIEAIFKQTRCARMIFSWTGPEDAVVLFDLLPRYAVVIGVAAARRNAQLIEDLARRIEIEILTAAHAARDLLHDPPISASLARWIIGFVDLYDASLAVTRDAFVFTPCRAGQHDIRITRSFRHEEIDADVEFQSFKRTTNIIDIRQTHHHVVTDGQQAANLTFAHLREHLDNRDS